MLAKSCCCCPCVGVFVRSFPSLLLLLPLHHHRKFMAPTWLVNRPELHMYALLQPVAGRRASFSADEAVCMRRALSQTPTDKHTHGVHDALDATAAATTGSLVHTFARTGIEWEQNSPTDPPDSQDCNRNADCRRPGHSDSHTFASPHTHTQGREVH